MRSISVRLIRDDADVGALNTFPQGNADAFVSGRYDALLSHANAIAAQWSAYYADRTDRADYRVIVVDTGATPTSPRGVKFTKAARVAKAAPIAKKTFAIEAQDFNGYWYIVGGDMFEHDARFHLARYAADRPETAFRLANLYRSGMDRPGAIDTLPTL